MKKFLQSILSVTAVIALIGGGYYIFKNYICKDIEDDFDDFEDDFDDFETEDNTSSEDVKDTREYVTLNPSDTENSSVTPEDAQTQNTPEHEDADDAFLYE